MVHEVPGCRHIQPVKGALDAGVDVRIESGADFRRCEVAHPLHRDRVEVDLDRVIRESDIAGDGLRRGTRGIPVSPVLGGAGERDGQGRDRDDKAESVGIHSLRMTAGRGCGQTGKAAHRRSITEDWSEESHLVGKGLLRLSVERVIPTNTPVLTKYFPLRRSGIELD